MNAEEAMDVISEFGWTAKLVPDEVLGPLILSHRPDVRDRDDGIFYVVKTFDDVSTDEFRADAGARIAQCLTA